jgi:hypothetical protein
MIWFFVVSCGVLLLVALTYVKKEVVPAEKKTTVRPEVLFVLGTVFVLLLLGALGFFEASPDQPKMPPPVQVKDGGR